MVNFNVKIICRNPRDSIAYVLSTRGFEDHDHVLVRAMSYNPEEPRKLGLDKATVERELAARKSLRRGKRRFRFRSGRTRRPLAHRPMSKPPAAVATEQPDNTTASRLRVWSRSASDWISK